MLLYGNIDTLEIVLGLLFELFEQYSPLEPCVEISSKERLSSVRIPLKSPKGTLN